MVKFLVEVNGFILRSHNCRIENITPGNLRKNEN